MLDRDNHAESGQNCEPSPQVKKHVYFGLVSIFYPSNYFFGPGCAPLIPLSFSREFSPFGAVLRLKPLLE
jgi:hypothetical protein